MSQRRKVESDPTFRSANQPPPFEDHNLYLGDRALQEAAVREGAAWAHARLSAWGERLGSAAALPAIAEAWLPRMLAREYDPRSLPIAEKTSALIGMGMTERQGGSDVRANVTRAERTADGGYRLTGHKWFLSAPMCDAHLVLARADGELSCFLLPRMLAEGTRNAVRILRLKDKLGNRSNASS